MLVVTTGAGAALAGALGLLLGSFLNVVAYRLPRGESLAVPASHCPGCDAPIKPYDNVLILQQPNWELQRTVVLTGEVQFPGRYSLRTRSERMGLTPAASRRSSPRRARSG